MTHAIFDSHAHYDDEAFDGDRDRLLSSMPSLGVGHILNAGASLAGCRASVGLSERYPYVYAARASTRRMPWRQRKAISPSWKC